MIDRRCGLAVAMVLGFVGQRPAAATWPPVSPASEPAPTDTSPASEEKPAAPAPSPEPPPSPLPTPPLLAPLPLLIAPPAPPADKTPAPAGLLIPDESTKVLTPRFGDPGQLVITSALSASIGHLGYSDSSDKSTSFGIEPAFDYFATRDNSQGLSVFFRYSDSTSGIQIKSTNLTYGATGRVGLNFPLGERASFWPKLAVGIWQSRSTFSASSGSGATVSVDGLPVPIGASTEVVENVVFIEVDAPFLFHPARHFFAGFGPQAYIDILHGVSGSSSGSSNQRTFVGAASTVGGWF